MKGLEVFLVLALTGVCVSAKLEHGLKVRFDAGFNPSSGKDFFFHIPLNISAAVQNNWKHLKERPEGHRPSLELYCQEDRLLCIFYDKGTGFISGLQICFPEEEFTDQIFDWSIQGYTKWTVTTDGKPVDYQCTAVFFNSQEYLDKPVAERIASITSNQILREQNIWTQGFHGKLDKWPSKISYFDNSLWTKQACIPWMGTHYYYNMTAETLCEANCLYPWFPLVDSEFIDELVGIGFIAFGKMPSKENKTNWFENPKKLAVQAIVPHGPQCLYNLADSPGLVTLHMYFCDNPWQIGCKIFG